jgi:hypothetical protein
VPKGGIDLSATSSEAFQIVLITNAKSAESVCQLYERVNWN